MCGTGKQALGLELNLDILGESRDVAEANRAVFDAAKVAVFNLMSSPGTGKTTLLEATLVALKGNMRTAVLEGDMTTELDADRLRVYDVPVVALTTGRSCHLDAHMVAKGLQQLDLDQLDLVFIENVGNLICPAEFPLGAHQNIVLVSVTEGEDKPLKYPVMFHEADCAVITKIDLSPYVNVNLDQLTANIHQIRPHIPIFALSATTGTGVIDWVDWLTKQVPLCND